MATTYREAERLMMPHINGSITDEELKEFLKHIETCEEYREKLEIYLTVDVGIRQLNQGMGTYSIRGALETTLGLSRQRAHTLGILEIARYTVDILCLWAVLAVLVLQSRM